MFKVLKGNNCQQRIIHTDELLFKSENKINIFSIIQRQRKLPPTHSEWNNLKSMYFTCGKTSSQVKERETRSDR